MMRLDLFLAEKGFFQTRNQSREAIKRQVVFVNGKMIDKPSKEVSLTDDIKIQERVSFVSIGGFKLEKALDFFNFDVKDRLFADIGASTGGFTDCLLKRGAKKVYAVDVGEGLLDKSLTDDERVVVMDRTNARYLNAKDFSETLDGVVVDCSFISLKLLLPAIRNILQNGEVFALIKPQFECGAKALGKSGVLKDEKIRQLVIEEIVRFATDLQFHYKGIVTAPVREGKNIEFIVWLSI